MKTGKKPKRPVQARGKARAAKAMTCANLSLPSGVGGGASKGQSIARVRVRVMTSVRLMSRYLRTRRDVSGVQGKGKYVLLMDAFAVKWKVTPNQGIGGSDKHGFVELGTVKTREVNYFREYV